MKIVVTLDEVLEHGNWDVFCELKGLNTYCINEGLARGDEEYELSRKEAEACGIMWYQNTKASIKESSVGKQQHTIGTMNIWDHGTDSNPSCILAVGDLLVLQTIGGNDVANAEFVLNAWNNHDKLVKAIELSGIGMDTMILPHNVAGVLEELGRKYGVQCCADYARQLHRVGEQQYAALVAAGMKT